MNGKHLSIFGCFGVVWQNGPKVDEAKLKVPCIVETVKIIILEMTN